MLPPLAPSSSKGGLCAASSKSARAPRCAVRREALALLPKLAVEGASRQQGRGRKEADGKAVTESTVEKSEVSAERPEARPPHAANKERWSAK